LPGDQLTKVSRLSLARAYEHIGVSAPRDEDSEPWRRKDEASGVVSAIASTTKAPVALARA